MFGFGDDFVEEVIIDEMIIDETIGYPGYGYGGYNKGYGPRPGYGYVDPFLAAEEVILAEEIVDDLFDTGW